jgi:hypothetical protein
MRTVATAMIAAGRIVVAAAAATVVSEAILAAIPASNNEALHPLRGTGATHAWLV